MAASTLLGLDQLPGELAGYGPISAELGREIAADATWRRLLTDPATGGLLDYGTTTYQPPAKLAAKVIARHRTCRFPGCPLPADRCQLDHVIEYPTGPTAETNLGPLSARCHRAKHRGGWHAELDPDDLDLHLDQPRRTHLPSPDRPPPRTTRTSAPRPNRPWLRRRNRVAWSDRAQATTWLRRTAVLTLHARQVRSL